jgi:hypothetical protein
MILRFYRTHGGVRSVKSESTCRTPRVPSRLLIGSIDVYASFNCLAHRLYFIEIHLETIAVQLKL